MKEILTPDATIRTLKRMAHEIIEKHETLDDVILVGIQKKGVPLAEKMAFFLREFTGKEIPVFALDITPFRDDTKDKALLKNDIETEGKRIILVDDVLYTGRSVRAALDALMIPGRPAEINLAILVDRGHREVPIRPDFIGKNIPTSRHEKIMVDPDTFSVFLDE